MANLERRRFLTNASKSLGMTLPAITAGATFLDSQTAAASNPISPSKQRAKSCILIYLWGGIAHQESWDPKPDAKSDYRGEFNPIATNVPGIHFCEHLPKLSQHADKLAIVRSLHHEVGGHGGALYRSLTAQPRPMGQAKDRSNWPSLTSMLSRFSQVDEGTPRAIAMPYLNYDNGALIQGQFGGWLGAEYDPIMMKTPAGKPYAGTSRYTDRELDLKLRLQKKRVQDRQFLKSQLNRRIGTQSDFTRFRQFENMAVDMLLSSPVNEAYNLENEDPRIRVMYGDHIGGQSMLLARRLTEAGVPVVQVNAGAGDLSGGNGDNWDTHRDHFTKMKKRLLPVLDQSLAALLTDLEQRGSLDETLVAVITDFGRTPKINNNAGRDHYPAVYSQLLAGGGISGGQVYGASDKDGVKPKSNACIPADFHATLYKAMGINPHAEVHDREGRPFLICNGTSLPLF